MEFLTAWDPIPNIVQKISEQFPEITVHYSWADEDIGNNTGRMDFKGGDIIMKDEYDKLCGSIKEVKTAVRAAER